MITAQALQVLQSYRSGEAMIDHAAYAKAGFSNSRQTHQRCADLRKAGFIEPAKGRGTTPQGRTAQLHRITEAGLRYLGAAPEEIAAVLPPETPRRGVGVSGRFLDRFHQLGKREPPEQKLGMLLRPTFVAEQGKMLVWGDWANIEARVLPWMAGDTPGANEKLDIFREVDKDPSLPDVYMRTAVRLVRDGPFVGATAQEAWDLYRKDDKLASDLRQSRGKVPELSLGFGGAVGALMAMATNYGVYLDPETAREVVELWRAENRWASRFWGSHGRDGSYGLWGAVNSAIEQPETIHVAGRVAYVYDPMYLDGTLFCALPCGRLLTYPSIRWEWREVENKKTGQLEDRYQLTFIKGYGRSALWYGKLAENVTQGYAASVLRRTLRRLDDPETLWIDEPAAMPVVMHTHDEVMVEVDEELADVAGDTLAICMERPEAYDADLPLKAEISTNWYYTKAKID